MGFRFGAEKFDSPDSFRSFLNSENIRIRGNRLGSVYIFVKIFQNRRVFFLDDGCATKEKSLCRGQFFEVDVYSWSRKFISLKMSRHNPEHTKI